MMKPALCSCRNMSDQLEQAGIEFGYLRQIGTAVGK